MTKKGRLTAEEWKIIKGIPEIGYCIAESSTKLKPIAELNYYVKLRVSF